MADAHPAGTAQSVLLQRVAASVPQHDPALLEARRKFSSHLENVVLDYKHYHPAQLDGCVATLDMIFGNVVQHPEDIKYRKIKATNKKLLTEVLSINHADELLLQAGWRPKVVEMEKYWTLDAQPGTHEFKVLQEAHSVIAKVRSSIHEKAERKRREEEEKKSRGAGERERIRLAIEDDRRQRQLTQELTAHHEPAVADQDMLGGAGRRPGSGPASGGTSPRGPQDS